MKIFKYTLQYGMNELFLPQDALFLDVQLQNDMLTIWTLAEQPEGSFQRNVLVCFTGKEIDVTNNDIYLGTVQHQDLVYHIFEILWKLK